jgi:hypothetical protein
VEEKIVKPDEPGAFTASDATADQPATSLRVRKEKEK